MEIDSREIITGIRKGIYKYLGHGSGRMVFDLNNGNIVKIAFHNRGIAQNRAEHIISSSDAGELFAKVLSASKNYMFLIMEKAEKIRDMSFVWNYFNVENNSQFKEKPELKEISCKYSLLLYDLNRHVNWGKKDGKPVIIDYGYTKNVKRRFY
jgi:SAM-dependent MidA family methyltransferase